MIFLKHEGKIHTRLAVVVEVVSEGLDGHAYTIVLMILAEKYRALDLCKHGASYFEGCNLLLQIWLIQYL